MNGKLNITVTIEGVQLPLTVTSTDEEKIYRDAATQVQDLLRKLREAYSELTDKHYYAMAMLNSAASAIRAKNRTETKPFVDVINDLNAEMDYILNTDKKK